MENAHATQPWASDPNGIRLDAVGEAVCALLAAVLAPAFAALLEKLMQLFAAWRDGTLPPIPPSPEPARRAPLQSSRVRSTTSRSRTPVLRLAPSPQAAPIIPHNRPARARARPTSTPRPLTRLSGLPSVFFKKRLFGRAQTHVHFVTIY